MPVVSVVTPVYHAEAFLDRAVASVLRQTFADWDMSITGDLVLFVTPTARRRGM
jgi:glycosyltransferase involved in cell wall biosynthesis